MVDEHDRLLAPNEPGELVYRSLLPDGMAREYYKEPAATVATWRNFMFHTGDIAYLDEDGRVHYRGRKQDRIRRRGENVSAAELEQIALGHPAVGEAAAFGVPGEFGEHEIKLDVVCVSDVGPARAARLAAGAAAAVHGAALPGAARRVPEDAERADREVQARGRPAGAPGGRRVRADAAMTAAR